MPAALAVNTFLGSLDIYYSEVALAGLIVEAAPEGRLIVLAQWDSGDTGHCRILSTGMVRVLSISLSDWYPG